LVVITFIVFFLAAYQRIARVTKYE
jgi:hypothetical protein